MAIDKAWGHAIKALAPVAIGISKRVRSDDAEKTYEDWLKEVTGGSASSQTPAGPPVTQNPMAASERGAMAGQPSVVPEGSPVVQNPMAVAEQGFLNSGIPVAERARSAMATEQPVMPVQPPPQTPQGGFAPQVQFQPQSASTVAGPPAIGSPQGGGFTAQQIANLQARLGNSEYGSPYIRAALMQYQAQQAAQQAAYERQMEMEKRRLELDKERRGFAKDLYIIDRKDKNLRPNPEATPYLNQVYQNIEAGQYTGAADIPGDYLPEGVQGPVRPERNVPLFEPVPETPDFQYMKGPTRANGTQELWQINKKTGEVTPVNTTSGIRVPGGGGGGGSASAAPGDAQWAKYQNNPEWKRLHGIRQQYGSYLDALMYARRSFANENSGVDGLMASDKKTVQIPMPAGDGQKTVQRSFRSDQDVINEIYRARNEYKKSTNQLKNKYGWTP